ncbi:MAG TPA: Pro-sigmaK processing inhibitor BofA [Lachnospiraceae bacterium]|nr:Pro-sigmaK processing inhibitor BofA [Lachnospiraceae bacterium]
MPEKQSYVAVNFFVRAILGFAMIFFINKFLASNDISLSVGLNPVTFVTSGVLGTPGVALLYGITFYQGL